MIKEIFDQTVSARDVSKAEAVRLKIKSNKAEKHMEQVFKSMDLLAQKQVFQDAEKLDEIKAAIEHLTSISDEEERPPRFVHSGAGAINANTEGSTQKSYNNSGPDIQYSAFFERDQGLAIAKDAASDDAGRDHDLFCLPHTRNDLLRDVRSWLDGKSAEHIYWLSGWAGTGKLTITRTTAWECHNADWQPGNFFFSRGSGDADHIQRFLGTFAMHLSQWWPA